MKKINLFISYSHKDKLLKDELINHLSSLKRRELINEWNDREIMAGQNWDHEISENLNKADIILLLLSSDFISSSYCFDKEVSRAMERHKLKETVVVPILLRHCDLEGLPFSELQTLPKDLKPVSDKNHWSSTDEAFSDIITEIKRIVTAIQTRYQAPDNKPTPSTEDHSGHTGTVVETKSLKRQHPAKNSINTEEKLRLDQPSAKTIVISENQTLKGVFTNDVVIESDITFTNFGTITGNVTLQKRAVLINMGIIVGKVINQGGSFENSGMVI